MATSVYFNNFGASQEQLLIENLIIESIKIYGHDVFYIPRTVVNKDQVFREAEYSSYNQAIMVEMYIRNIDGFAGDGEFLSKFGVEVRDQMTFTMAQRVFAEEVGDALAFTRPREGDLIFFTLTQSLFQIKFVNVKPIFYQLGALQTYDIVCELYEGNSDIFNTGIPSIDDVYSAYTLVSDDYVLLAQDGSALTTEDGETIILQSYSVDAIDPNAQNDMFEQEGLDFIDFTEIDPFSEGGARA